MHKSSLSQDITHGICITGVLTLGHLESTSELLGLTVGLNCLDLRATTWNNTCLSPPPALCLMLSSDPTLDVAVSRKFSFVW